MKKIAPRAVEVLRGLLEKVPTLQVKSIETEAVSGDGGPDLIARLLVDGRTDNLGTPGPRCCAPWRYELESG